MAGKLQHAYSSRMLAAYIVLYTKGRESGGGREAIMQSLPLLMSFLWQDYTS